MQSSKYQFIYKPLTHANYQKQQNQTYTN